MTNPNDKIPEEFSGNFRLEIGVDWFLDKFCRGIHGFAVVTKEYGDYLRTKDPDGTTLHVDYADATNTICHVYPIHLWREAVRRWELQKATAELERQKRYARDEAARVLAEKYKQREAEIERVTLLFKARFPGFINKNSAKLCRSIVVQSLQGRTKPEIQKALGVCPETIAEFLALPQPAPTEEDLLMGLVQEPEKPSTEVRVV